MQSRRWVALAALAAVSGMAPVARAASNPIPPHQEGKAQVSQQQAEEIFRKLDDVLKFVSTDSKLPIERPVKRKLSNRDQVEQNLKDRLKNDKDAKRMQRAEVVLKKFGFLPRDFDLEDYFIQTMREQVAGYYNIDDKTVYMMDWIPVEQQLPVMAHELTHALQDQNVDLDKWLRGDEEDGKKAEQKPSITAKSNAPVLNEGAAAPKPAEKPRDPDLEIKQDEEQTARQAVVEGQGMVVMVDYLLKDANQSAMTSPDVVEALKEGMRSNKDYPVYANAPLYLRESIEFPYEYGMDFIREVLFKGGREMAYRGVLQNPPVNTRQVMEPKTYLNGEKLLAMHLPAMAPIFGKNYELYDVGAVGEFDVMALLQQFANERTADKLYPAWRGGAYYAARILNPDAPAKKPGEKEESTKSIALLYLSRWATPEAAKRFASEYGTALLKRYKFAQSVVPEGVDEKTAAQLPARRWLTDEGPVLVECRGNSVLALESFDPTTMEKLRKQVFEVEAAANPEAAEPRTN